MADIKKINGYLIKDETARGEIAKIKNGTEPVGQATNATYAQNAYNYTLSGGNIVGSIKDKFDNVDQTIADYAEKIAEVQTDVAAAQDTANQAKSIAEGRVRAVVFDTVAAMTAALKAAAKTDYKIGDNLLIEETGVPDYWISGILDTNTGTYGYYTISPLETQKVDLTEYAKTADLTNGTITVKKSESANNAASAGSADNYNTASGGIKNKFDTVDSEITKIKDGTTTVKKSALADGWVDDSGVTQTFIDTFGLLAEGLSDFKDGTIPAAKATTAQNYDTNTGNIKSKFDALDAKNIRFTYNAGTEELTISFS